MNIIVCPHCKDFIEIKDINCGIFRHGVLKSTGCQIDPHSSKMVCDNFIKDDLIFGCGKPFSIKVESERNNEFVVNKCEYI